MLVTDVGPLRKLTLLEDLWLDGTQVADIEPLSDLTQLQWLNLTGTLVTDLSPLVKMKNVTIYVYENQQVTIPEELSVVRVTRLTTPRSLYQAE